MQRGTIELTGAGEAGFSMIELMFAVVIISLGLVSVAGISVYISRTNSTSGTLSVLATSVQDQADKLRMGIWDAISEDPKLSLGGSVDYGSSDNNHRATATGTPVGDINLSWKVSNGPGTTGDARTITIKAVQVNAPARFANGIIVTMIVSKN